jgi:hypothetical protein
MMNTKLIILGFIAFGSLISCTEKVMESSTLEVEPKTNPSLKSASISHYVAKTGKDSNPGTSTSPFLTITKGLSVASAGDTVFVKAGTYNEGNNLQLPKSGAVGNPITIKNYGKDVVWVTGDILCIYGSGKSYVTIDGINCQNSSVYNLRFDNCSNIIVKNLTSSNSLTSSADCIEFHGCSYCSAENVTAYGGVGMTIGGTSDHITIKGGSSSYSSLDGINMENGSTSNSAEFDTYITIDGTEVHHNARQGIVTQALDNATFKNFWSHHNGATGLQIEDNSSNVVIEDFICENNSQLAEWTYETGLWVDDAKNITVQRGTMRNNQTGLRVTYSTNVLASYNLIYSNQDGYSDGNSSGIDFYNSDVTLYNSVIDGNSSTTAGINRGSVSLRGTGTYTLKNNIISNDQSKYDIFRSGTNKIIEDNNLIYNTRTLNIYNLTKAESWSTYKTESGQGAHSITTNPLFTDKANGNFNLQSTSPAINAGVNVGLTADYLKNAILTTPDIGAIEYTQGQVSTTVYYNIQTSATATKSDCGTGYTGTTVTYTVAAGKYSSTISQADADSKAVNDLSINKQAYANANGTCTAIPVYYNVQQSGTATKSDCGTGYSGSTVTYIVPANKYSSTISQTDANNQAITDVNNNKQAYANTNGTCTKKRWWLR